MPNLTYITGDATQPIGEGKKIIAHVCNDIGGYGSGFVMALRERFPQAELHKTFRNWQINDPLFGLGAVQFVEVATDIIVANIVAQEHIYLKVKQNWIRTELLSRDEREKITQNFQTDVKVPPIRYDALVTGLKIVEQVAKILDATVHAPRLGSDRAGGSWKIIESILQETLVEKGIDVTVYDLPKI